jgi:LmbE family N-acetylglucosaminyl deacetylase
MKKLVIIPGGFHPFHAGHKALYDAARDAFPSADIYVAATADISNRPFPFEVKKKLARIAGVDGHRFIQVKSPFRAEEITQHYDPANTVLIFARSEKDRDQQPRAGGIKKDGTASYLQSFKRNGLQPMNQHGYMVYLPTVQFGPGMTSATEIRAKWPGMDAEQKSNLVQQLYPDTQVKTKLVDVIVQMLDHVMGGNKEVDEAVLINDPDGGHQIIPDGGMGTWDEASMVNNLARKFGEMVNMVKGKNYTGLQYVLYKGGVVKSLVDALAEYELFMQRQGRRPIARGREIDMSQIPVSENPDYIEEGEVVQFPSDRSAPPDVDQAHQLATKIIDISKDEKIADPGPRLAPLRQELQRLGYRLRMDNGGMRLIHTVTNWNTIIDPMK